MRPDPHKYCILPCLHEKMVQAGATLESLARASGVSTGPINRARNGGKIHVKFAAYIYGALNSKKFERGKSGPSRWPASMDHRRLKTQSRAGVPRHA